MNELGGRERNRIEEKREMGKGRERGVKGNFSDTSREKIWDEIFW